MFRSVKRMMIYSYALVILFLVVVFCLIYYRAIYQNFVTSQTRSSAQMAKLVSSSLDAMVSELDELSKSLVNSTEITDYVFDETGSALLPYMNSRFNNTVYGIAGYSFAFDHMNIMTLDGLQVQFGRKYSADSVRLPDEFFELLRLVDSNRGTRVLTALSTPTGLPQSTAGVTISLLRAFSNYPLGDPRALLELQIDTDNLREAIDNAYTYFPEQENAVVVFDSQNRLIYPPALSDERLAFYAEHKNSAQASAPDGDIELMSSCDSVDTGWTTLITVPRSVALSPMLSLRWTVTVVGALTFAALLAVVYAIAQRISIPLARDRSLAMQARMMALQTQMNPHFLYNSLNIMAVLAEESGSSDLMKMCSGLIEMMRYILKDFSGITTIGAEVEYCRRYTDMMGVRFGDKVQVTYEIADQLYEVWCPRLVLQPLVENSIKYAREGGAALLIRVCVLEEDGRWLMSVEDNGAGIVPGKRAEIARRISDIERARDLSALSLEGLGLANIYLRLKLFCKGEQVFEIKTPEQGTAIVIGGKI